MNKETLSATPENEPTSNQWEDPEIPKNMEDMPLRVDLNSEAFQSKFADAEIMAKRGTVTAEQITAEGLENGAYNDVYFDDADGKYKMNTYVMEGEGDQRQRRLENTHDVEPGMWITTNPKQQESDYPNSYPIEDKKFHKLYETSDEEGVYKAKGLAKLIPNETGREVEIELPESWGGGFMSGAKDCFFRQPCDIDGNPTGRPSIIAADAVKTTYGSLAEIRPDLILHAQEKKETPQQEKMEARRIEKAKEKSTREAERQYVIEHKDELLKRGEDIVSPDKQQEWRQYLEYVVNGDESNVDVEKILDVVQKLNSGEPLSDVKDYLQKQKFASFNDEGSLWDFRGDKLPDGRTTMAYNAVRNRVARLADRGQEFWDYSAIGRIPTDEEIRAEFPWKEM